MDMEYHCQRTAIWAGTSVFRCFMLGGGSIEQGLSDRTPCPTPGCSSSPGKLTSAMRSKNLVPWGHGGRGPSKTVKELTEVSGPMIDCNV